MINFEIDNIVYKRKVIDSGVILGTRKHIFDLSMAKLPCKAKDETGKRLVSKITPHRKNCVIYIPEENLVNGFIFRLTRRNTEKEPVKETTYQVTEKGLNWITCQILSEQEPAPKRKPATTDFQHVEPKSAGDLWFVSNPEKHFQEYIKNENVLSTGKVRCSRCSSTGTPSNLDRIENFEFFADTSKDILSFNGREFRKKTSFCFVFSPENKRRYGSPFQKVQADLIFDESFIFCGKEYHVLTGLPVEYSFPESFKPSPRYKELK